MPGTAPAPPRPGQLVRSPGDAGPGAGQALSSKLMASALMASLVLSQNLPLLLGGTLPKSTNIHHFALGAVESATPRVSQHIS